MVGQHTLAILNTLPETNMAPEKKTGKGDSYWKSSFLVAMLVLGRVVDSILPKPMIHTAHGAKLMTASFSQDTNRSAMHPPTPRMMVENHGSKGSHVQTRDHPGSQCDNMA